MDEFRPRFFDLTEMPYKEVKLKPEEEAAYQWGGSRHLTRVSWDPQSDFVIEVGDTFCRFALEDLQKQLADEYSSHNTRGDAPST